MRAAIADGWPGRRIGQCSGDLERDPWDREWCAAFENHEETTRRLLKAVEEFTT